MAGTMKCLTLDDMKPAGPPDFDNYTDADARKHGYLSLKVMKLEWDLTRIAANWRDTKEDGLVHEYRSVLYKMILYGYDVSILPIQDQLPDELMPELPPENVQAAIQNEYATE